MAVDDVQLFNRLVQLLGSFQADVVVAGAVSAVATDAVLFVELVRQGVQEGFFRHGLVERGIEYGHVLVSQRREYAASFTDTDQVSRVVQRCVRNGGFDAGDHVFADDNGRGEALATVNNTVTDGDQVLGQFRIERQDLVDDEVQRFLVSGTRAQIGTAFLAIQFPLDAGVVEVEALGQAGQQVITGGCVNDGKLQGRAATVKNKNQLTHE